MPFLASRMASSHAEGHPSLPEADRLVSGQLLLKLVRDVDLLVHLHQVLLLRHAQVILQRILRNVFELLL